MSTTPDEGALGTGGTEGTHGTQRAVAPSRRSKAVAMASRSLLRPQLTGMPLRGAGLAYLRAGLAVTGRVVSLPLVGGTAATAYEKVDTYGKQGETIQGEWVRGASATTASIKDGVVLYVHGGGYIASSPRTLRGATSALSHLTGRPVLAMAYRRAPEHPFPAAADDVAAAYTWLLDAGVRPSRIALAGDSAGAHLILGLLVQQIRARRTAPACAVLFSPLLDPASTDANDRDGLRRDPVIAPDFARRAASTYLRGQPTDDLRITPLRASDQTLAKLPPILTFVGSTECFGGDAERLHERLEAVGVDQRLAIVPGQVHSFITLAGALPEARASLDRAARFILQHSSGKAAPTIHEEAPVARWYPLTPADDDFLRAARAKTVQVLDVAVPPEKLWAALAADDAVKAWSPAVTRVTWTGPVARGVGTVREVTIGGAVTVREKFYRWDDGSRMTFCVAESSRPGIKRMAEDYVVEATATGSRLTWTVALEPSHLGDATAPVGAKLLDLMVGSMTRGLRAGLLSGAR